jgi:uncharacterized tellurite resistance protein B-like protein
MPTVLVMLLIVAVLAVLVWQSVAKRSARDTVLDGAIRLHALARRGSWAWRSRKRPLEQVDSPMLAATCVMVLAVRCDRDVAPTDRDRMAEQAARTFAIDRSEADALVAKAIHAVRNVSDEANWAARLATRLYDHTTEAERAQVPEMITAMAADGTPSHPRRHLAHRYARAAGLPEPSVRSAR